MENLEINLQNASLETSAAKESQFPPFLDHEVVLVGKSNVGKSSFINTMLNRKNLARTSNTPGKTQLINFYNIDNCMYFVDLPGYGYNKMGKQKSQEVGKNIENYLAKRGVSLIVFLIDIRHKPTKDDLLMYNYILSTNLPFIIVANKADKIAKTKVPLYVEKLKEFFGISYSQLIPFSAVDKRYQAHTWDIIINMLNAEN